MDRADKPSSVVDDHVSGTLIAQRLERLSTNAPHWKHEVPSYKSEISDLNIEISNFQCEALAARPCMRVRICSLHFSSRLKNSSLTTFVKKW